MRSEVLVIGLLPFPPVPMTFGLERRPLVRCIQPRLCRPEEPIPIRTCRLPAPIRLSLIREGLRSPIGVGSSRLRQHEPV
jgi:hypothetical protein